MNVNSSSLKLLKSIVSHNSFLVLYQEKKSDMAMFIMVGVREYPRATIAYLYLFNYWDAFLPLFFCTVTVEGDHTIQELIKMVCLPFSSPHRQQRTLFRGFPLAIFIKTSSYLYFCKRFNSNSLLVDQFYCLSQP